MNPHKRNRDSRNLRTIASTHISRFLNKKGEGEKERGREGMKPFICKADVVCRAGARYRQKTSKQSLSGIEDRRRVPTSISICSASWRGSADNSLQSDNMRHNSGVKTLPGKLPKNALT